MADSSTAPRTSPTPPSTVGARNFPRHTVATLAYRSWKTLRDAPPEFADTHTGQLALLRRRADAPVRAENYARAEIVVGRTGIAQAPARSEFD
jgi:hypothetical protein